VPEEDQLPTYQYACTECDARLEAVQSFSDDALTECPQCHGRLRKVFSAVGVVFKGSGFYRTDSRSASTSTGSAGESKTGSGDSKSTDKPAAKTESSTPAAAPAKKADSAA
jgi:putative FmdB family regulatory protein